MALDPRLSLGVRTPDIGQAFSNALLNVQGVQNIQQAPLRNRLLEAQVGTAEAGQTEAQQLNRVRSLALFGSDIAQDVAAGNLESIRNKTVQRISQDLPNQGVPSNDSQELLALIDDPNISEQDKLARIGQLSQQAITKAQRFGVLQKPLTGTASQRDFETFQRLQAQARASGDPAAIEAANQFGRQAGFFRESAQELADIGVQKASDIARGAAGVELETKPEIEAAVTTEVGKAEAATPLGKQKLEINRQKQIIDKEKAKTAQRETNLKRAEAVSQADSTIALIDSLIAHPGRIAATGTSSALPTRPGSRAADFEADFNRLKGSAFLEAVQALKGSGQISNAEGEAATASILGVEIGQSEEGFIESLKSLKSRITEAKKRRSNTFEITDETIEADFDLEFDPVTGTFK